MLDNNWIGFVTGHHWGPEFSQRESNKLRQNKINKNCTIFVDRAIPLALDYNIKNRVALLCEPDFVCPEVRHWLLSNKHLFSDIIELDTGFDFTGEVWVENKKIYPKTKNVSAIFSNKFIKGVRGYELRREIASKMKSEIEIYGTIPGGRALPQPNRTTKILGLKHHRYSVVIDNIFDYVGTEKLHDSIACGTIPIYWASKENPALRYYNTNGMFLFETVDQLRNIISNKATEENYIKMLPYVQENFKNLLKVNWNFVILEYCGFKRFLKAGGINE